MQDAWRHNSLQVRLARLRANAQDGFVAEKSRHVGRLDLRSGQGCESDAAAKVPAQHPRCSRRKEALTLFFVLSASIRTRGLSLLTSAATKIEVEVRVAHDQRGVHFPRVTGLREPGDLPAAGHVGDGLVLDEVTTVVPEHLEWEPVQLPVGTNDQVRDVREVFGERGIDQPAQILHRRSQVARPVLARAHALRDDCHRLVDRCRFTQIHPLDDDVGRALSQRKSQVGGVTPLLPVLVLLVIIPAPVTHEVDKSRPA